LKNIDSSAPQTPNNNSKTLEARLNFLPEVSTEAMFSDWCRIGQTNPKGKSKTRMNSSSHKKQSGRCCLKATPEAREEGNGNGNNRERCYRFQRAGSENKLENQTYTLVQVVSFGSVPRRQTKHVPTKRSGNLI
jgi:hypothetical protein